jgi:two-component system response regulator FixJ
MTLEASGEVILQAGGFTTARFPDGSSFLEAALARTPACVLLDVNMPGRSGLDVLRELNADKYPAPVFMMSGAGDIPTAVEAIRNGAYDFIEKPFYGSAVLERVRTALAASAERRNSAPTPSGFRGEALLTAREREVLAQIAGGASNKEAGRTLAISPRTVEVHRARIMDKLGAKNAADLVRIVLGGPQGG